MLDRRIGVHDLNHRSGCCRVECLVGHEQGRARRQQPIEPGSEVRRQFEPGNRHRIDLRSLLPHVPGHADSQPTEFGWIGIVGIGHAARCFGEHQCVIDKRCITDNGQAGSADLNPVAIVLDPQSIPGWNDDDYRASRAAGDAWLLTAPTAILLVPSVVFHAERNALINPAHNDFARIRMMSIEPVLWDDRLFPPRR